MYFGRVMNINLKEEKEEWNKRTHQEWIKEAEMLYDFLKEIDII